MELARINCHTANCQICQSHILLKENMFGTKIYTCAHHPKKHKVIKAENCGEFRCLDYGISKLCDNCNIGEPVIRTNQK